MSIRVKRCVDAIGEIFFTLMQPDNEKSFTIHHASRLDGIRRDFEGRVEDESTY